MNYLSFGTGKNLIVFLHGWGADKNSFLWLKDYFEEEWRVIFVDFDGFGDSSEPDGPMFVRDYVNNLKSIIDRFNPQKLVLVGHSFGGRIAIKFSFLYQSIYEKLSLVLVDSAGILPKRNLMYHLRVRRYKRLKRRAIKNKNLEEKLNRFGSKDYKVLSPVMKQTFVNVVNEDLSHDAKFIKTNTIIVWGDKDKETKAYMARKLKRLINGSKLYFLKGAGHFSFLEKKEEFVIILDTFLKNI
jgi:pimeloyl-ACP methyl ester carboxylesterase